MADKSLTDEWKELANLIVGMWYNEKENYKFIFSLSEKLLARAKLLIIKGDRRPESTFYTIGTQLSKEIEFKTTFYFDISFMGRPKYAIKSISPDKMVLRLMDFTTYEEIGSEIEFKRLNDLSFADDILKGLD